MQMNKDIKSKIEYIYLLQREMDKKYNVFKAGRASSIKNRLNASDYRRADIYLVRGVCNSALAEKEIFDTLNKLGFDNAKKYYNGLDDESLHDQFGNEDYIIKNDIYEIVNIINIICDKYKFEPKIESENPDIIPSIFQNSESLVPQKSSKLESESSSDSVDIGNICDFSESSENETIQTTPPLLQLTENMNMPTLKFLNIKMNDQDLYLSVEDSKKIKKDLFNEDENKKYQQLDIKLKDVTNTSYSKVDYTNVYNLVSIPKLTLENPSKVGNSENVKHKNTILKVDYEHFKRMFSRDGLLYVVQDKKLFETYYSNIIDIKIGSYPIETITNITEIVFDRLFLKRSPKISSVPIIKSPYLTQVIIIDKLIIVGINTSNIYDPLTIKFYIPNNAFQKEIRQWEITGVLRNPLQLRYFKSHGYNCYTFSNI